MLDSYEEGQQLHADDFIDDYYMPEGKWQYAEVVSIDDDIVTLSYHGEGGDETMEWTRAEMEHMLGWDLSKDDDRLDGGSESNKGGKPSEDELEFF